MKTTIVIALLATAGLVWTAQRAVSDEPPAADPARAKRIQEILAPGKWHKDLAWYEGTWDVEASMSMPDPSGKAQTTPAEKGTAVFSWAIPGRWMTQDLKVPFGGTTMQLHFLHGYDNHTKNFVSVGVNSMDTAMNLFRGVEVDPQGKVFTQYGTINEWMDDTYNKPVKVVSRKIDADHFETEVWDLQIGENGHPVLKYRYARKKS
jgi:hypothetical protein